MRLAIGFLVACCAVLLAACGENMRLHSRLQPYEPSPFFADGQSERQVISGTVALGTLHPDDPLYTGKVGDQLATTFPLTITRAVLARGQGRFNIYCAPCHGMLGNGQGMVVARGFSPPPTFHQQRLRDAPVGHFFDVITNGYGRMYSYASRVGPEDRWAIIAYIRALQLSQNATSADVAAMQRLSARSQAPGPDSTAGQGATP